MKDKLIIIGAGGHGKVVADVARQMNQWETIAFLDDKISTGHFGYEVIGRTDQIELFANDYEFAVAIGNNDLRKEFFSRLERMNASLPIIKHPSAIIGDKVNIGAGTVIMPGAIINCYTSIGKGCIINTGSSVDHDCIIEDYVHISPGVHLAGSVKVGNYTFIGIGSVIVQNVTIPDKCILGAGTVVVKEIIESGTYVGVPAKKIK